MQSFFRSSQKTLTEPPECSFIDGVPHSLYSEPDDLPFYHENMHTFEAFKPVLRAILARRRQSNLVKTVQLQQEYAAKWARWREYSKQAEDKHKAGVWQLQLLENVANLRRTRRRKLPEPLEEKKDTNTRFLDSLADIPPLILDEEQRKIHYIDNNGLIPDPKTLDIRENLWLPEEEKSFVELFRSYHKNFEQISSHLPYKSTKECIKFYYLNKKRLFKEEKPKHKSNSRKRTRNTCKIMNSRVMSHQYYNSNFVESNH